MPQFIKDKALCHASIFIRILSGHHGSSYSSGLQDKYLFLFSMDGNSLSVCRQDSNSTLNALKNALVQGSFGSPSECLCPKMDPVLSC